MSLTPEVSIDGIIDQLHAANLMLKPD